MVKFALLGSGEMTYAGFGLTGVLPEKVTHFFVVLLTACYLGVAIFFVVLLVACTCATRFSHVFFQ